MSSIFEKNLDQPDREDSPFDKLNDPDIQAAFESLISIGYKPSTSCPPLGVHTQAETTLDERHTGASSLPVGYRFTTDVSSSSVESQQQSPSTNSSRPPLADVPLSYLLNAVVELTQTALLPGLEIYVGKFGVVINIDKQSDWVCIYAQHETTPANICINSMQAAMLKVLPPIPGDKVRVVRGHYAGLQGTLSSQHDNQQVVVEFEDGASAVLFLKDLIRLHVQQGAHMYNHMQSSTCGTSTVSPQNPRTHSDPRTHSNTHTVSPNSNHRPATLLPSCDWQGSSPVCSPMDAYNGLSDTSPASSLVDQSSSSLSPANPLSVCSPSEPTLFNPTCTISNNTSIHDPTLTLHGPGMSSTSTCNGSLHDLSIKSPYDPRMSSNDPRTSSNSSLYSTSTSNNTPLYDPRMNSDSSLYDPSNTTLYDPSTATLYNPGISTNSSLYDPASSTTSMFEPISTFLSRPTFLYDSTAGHQRRQSMCSDTSDLASPQTHSSLQVTRESCPTSETTYSSLPPSYSSTQSYSPLYPNPSQFSNHYGVPLSSTYSYNNLRPQYRYGLTPHNIMAFHAAALASYPNGYTYAQPRPPYNYLRSNHHMQQQPPPYSATLNQTGQTFSSPTSNPMTNAHMCPRSNQISSTGSMCNKDGVKLSSRLKDNPWEEFKTLLTSSKHNDLFCQKMHPVGCRKAYSFNIVVERAIEVLLTKEPPVHWYNPLSKEDDGDSESDLSTESIRVSTLCPLTKQKMEYPCRGLYCTHLQCFDANAFLQLALKRRCQSTSVKTISSSSHLDNGWKCPVCGKVVCPKQLFIEKYFKKTIEACEAVELEFRGVGKWEPIEKCVAKSSVIDLTMDSDDEG